MAVEPPHMNFFSPQLPINNRELTKLNQQFYNASMDGTAIPMPMSSTIPESFLPFHLPPLCEPISHNKADSTVTYHIPASRKRFREQEESNILPLPQKIKLSSQPSFLDQNLLHHFQTQQLETDFVIAQHTEKVRREIEEQRMKQSRMILSAVAKELKKKEEEVQRMEKLNQMLEEKAKTLIMENQIWREMAMTNESAVNTLRGELEQVLAHVSKNHHHHGGDVEDVASSCGSNNHVKAEVVEEEASSVVVGKMCNGCGVRESVVLLLPCRHLCLCTMCGTHIRNCPLCFSGINASVHVNFS